MGSHPSRPAWGRARRARCAGGARGTVATTRVKVQKTQISCYNRHMYACVSFLRVRRKADMPDDYFVLTLGMSERLDTPRAAVVTEPYPGRWTTHLVVSQPDDLDEELFGWIAQAYHFAQEK